MRFLPLTGRRDRSSSGLVIYYSEQSIKVPEPGATAKMARSNIRVNRFGVNTAPMGAHGCKVFGGALRHYCQAAGWTSVADVKERTHSRHGFLMEVWSCNS